MLIPLTQVHRNPRLRSASKTLRGFRDRFADEQACVRYLLAGLPRLQESAYDRRKTPVRRFPITFGPDLPKRLHISQKNVTKPESERDKHIICYYSFLPSIKQK